ncbi:Reverse transcriptase zinc-binding domain [Arabidopsis thaliana x Arabidopsis arenosa]|uniref:Reverse transcriptase zinc-binding domain n=1 Tax=Arabidopsis thaliana x Arabidopsis arenosa TaxID=1240361 RepID=A0A8T2A4Q4_9BRAS|nr:Reverse transcriptase zinc-binding domain [Arabidopsis thaliana x Arabidopsis arenosa]
MILESTKDLECDKELVAEEELEPEEQLEPEEHFERDNELVAEKEYGKDEIEIEDGVEVLTLTLLDPKDHVKKGLRFCIGDGSLINAWLDPWLPLHTPRPPRKTSSAPDQIMVRELLTSTITYWDLQKINDWIVPEDIDTIPSIKICSTAKEDLLGWHYTRDRMFIVKSAYWLATHLPENDPPQPPPGNIQLKQLLWKITTAPKIKHFCWKFLLGALPTGETLRRRHINRD